MEHSKTSIFILEDDILQAKGLALRLLEAGYEVSGIAHESNNVLALIETKKPDILIIDVDLGSGIDGITFVENLYQQQEHKTPVIFTTRKNDDTSFTRASKTLPISYLVKPFNFLQLSIALETAIEIASIRENKISNDIDTGQPPYLLHNAVFIKEKYIFHRVDIQDILLIEAQRQYTQIHTTDRSYLQSVNLESISRKLDHPDIVRVHRSYMINIGHIANIQGKQIELKNSSNKSLKSESLDSTGRIPIGEKYKNPLMEMLRVLN